MAVMFPKNINELDPQDSELEVYNQFRKQLDDSYTVFYSVEWNRKRKEKMDHLKNQRPIL